MSILSVNTIIPFSNSNIEIESGSIQGNVIGTTTTASYVQLQNVDGHTEFSQSVATALENTDSFPYTGSAVISGSLTFSSDSNFIPPKGTDLQKPSNPEAGTFYYNTDNGNVEVYTGNMWAILSFENVMSARQVVANAEVFDGEGKLFLADGGIITTYTSGGLNYQAHTFLTSDTLEVYTDITVDYLLVAGGGGGGNELGGGGGGGGFVTGTSLLSSGSYEVDIGSGGSGAVGNDNNTNNGSKGSSTQFIGITADGGGYGGGRENIGGSGGSGGGSGCANGSSSSATQPNLNATGTFYIQTGNDGGSGGGNSPNYPGGGGGGADQQGESPSSSSDLGGDGGNGLQNDYDGILYFYSGGGGASAYVNGGAGDGGAGGGGGGSSNTNGGFGAGGAGRNNGENGQANSDSDNSFPGGAGGENTGGGGGCGAHQSGPGGNGGSGIVIIRYQV